MWRSRETDWQILAVAHPSSILSSSLLAETQFSLVQMVASLLHPHPSTWLRKLWLSSNARVNPDLSEFKCWQFWSSENVCWDASGKRSLTPKELLRSLSTSVHSHVWVWLLELQQPFHKQEENNGGQSWDSEDGSTERWKDSRPLMTPSRC